MSIKKYGIQQVDSEVIPSARFSPNADPAAYGSEQGKMMEKAGGAVQDAAKGMAQAAARSQEATERAVVRDALVQASGEIMISAKQRYGTQGKDAINAAEEFKQDVIKTKDKYDKLLKTDSQRELFGASFESRALTHYGGLLRHQENQRKKYEDETLDAHVASAHDLALQYKDDPAAMKEQRLTIIADTATKYKEYGQDVMNQKVKERLHALNEDVANVYIREGRYDQAEKFLGEKGSEMNPVKLSALQETISQKKEDQFSIDAVTKLSDSGLPVEEQLSQVDKICLESGKPELIGRIRSAVKSRYEDMEQYHKFKRRKFVEGVTDEAVQAALSNKRYAPPEGLSPSELSDVSDVLKKINKKAFAEKLVKNGIKAGINKNPKLVNNLLSLPSDELATTEIESVMGQMSLDEFIQVRKAQKVARLSDDDPKKQEFFTGQIIQQTARQKITGIRDIEQSPDLQNKYFDQVNKVISRLPKEELTPEKINEAIAGLTDRVTAKGAKYRFEMAYLPAQDVAESVRNRMSYQEKKGTDVHPTERGFSVTTKGGAKIDYDRMGSLVSRN